MDTIDYFKNLWDEKAQSEDIFVQMGRSSSSFKDFFLTVKEIKERLDLQQTDVVLDAGGGAGWFSIAISSFVREVVLFDFSERLIENARGNSAGFDNIQVFVDDLLKLDKIPNKQFTKVISGSTLQYLENLSNIRITFANLYRITAPGAKILLTLNPDRRKKDEHIASYYRLNWEPDRINKSLELEEIRFWSEPGELIEIAREVGFKRVVELKVHESSWFSTHMYDLLIEK